MTALAPHAAPLMPDAGSAQARIDILHVPFTYFPDPVGGTEVYVAGLVRGLRAAGFRSAVAAPGPAETMGEHDGAPVYRFAGAPNPGLAAAYGEPDEAAAAAFSTLVGRLQPRLVHLHSHSAAVSRRLVDVAKDHGAKVILTYHTPTASCARGSMMLMGRTPCDGKLDVRRCARCVLQGHGAPPPLDLALAYLPEGVGEALGRAGLGGGVFTALRLPGFIGAAHRNFRILTEGVDCVVAVCDWVEEVLRTNGVPASKIVACRQGVEGASTAASSARAAWRGASEGPLRIGYFGRVDAAKGIDTLIKALRCAPALSVRLDVYGVAQAGAEADVAALQTAAAADPRVVVHRALAPERVGAAMADCDVVAVPSRVLETGPMVVLEAFSVGTPVLGARLGGIAELVTDGVDGVLVDGHDPAKWAQAITGLATDPARLAALHRGVRPPRTMDDVARDMAALYATLLAADGC
ncbi:MAG TPA: glycosyltransferase [Caulobacteraceae bacterium]|jgi:glycosyltransferase involved in cell wall biosynthesis